MKPSTLVTQDQLRLVLFFFFPLIHQPLTYNKLKFIIMKMEIEITSEQISALKFIANCGNSLQYSNILVKAFNKLLPENIEVRQAADLPFETTMHESAKVKPGKAYRKVENLKGFTAQEYSTITGYNVPNMNSGAMLQEGADNKVYYHSENGNISILGGADTFSNEGTLCTELLDRVPIEIMVKA